MIIGALLSFRCRLGVIGHFNKFEGVFVIFVICESSGVCVI